MMKRLFNDAKKHLRLNEEIRMIAEFRRACNNRRYAASAIARGFLAMMLCRRSSYSGFDRNIYRRILSGF